MMRKTMHDLPEALRTQVVDRLNGHLAEAIDLALRAKHAHWNIRGPGAPALACLFNKVAKHARHTANHFGHRIVQLGGIAQGTVALVSKNTTLETFPVDIPNEEACVRTLAQSVAAFGKSLRDCVAAIQGLHVEGADGTRVADDVTAELIAEMLERNDKYLSKLEAALG